MDSSFVLVLLAVLSGVAFSLIGIAFRIGQNRGVIPLHITMGMALGGALFWVFQVKWSLIPELPWFVYLFALLNCLGQIVAMHMTKVCLNKGPLSPLWAAMNLTFIPVTIYAALMFSEAITLWQVLAMAAGVVCVIFAANLSTEGEDVASKQKKQDTKTKIQYAGLLVLVLLGNSTMFIGLKDMGTRMVPGTDLSYLSAYLPPIYFILYISLALFAGITAWLQKAKPRKMFDLVWLGAMAAVGSISGMFLLKVCMPLPAALVFTINGMITILGGAIVSVLFFKEKVVSAWYGTIGFGLLAIVLANIG